MLGNAAWGQSRHRRRGAGSTLSATPWKLTQWRTRTPRAAIFASPPSGSTTQMPTLPSRRSPSTSNAASVWISHSSSRWTVAAHVATARGQIEHHVRKPADPGRDRCSVRHDRSGTPAVPRDPAVRRHGRWSLPYRAAGARAATPAPRRHRATDRFNPALPSASRHLDRRPAHPERRHSTAIRFISGGSSAAMLVGMRRVCYAPALRWACGRGGTGRRAALRSLWGKPRGKFESSRPHQPITAIRRSGDR